VQPILLPLRTRLNKRDLGLVKTLSCPSKMWQEEAFKIGEQIYIRNRAAFVLPCFLLMLNSSLDQQL